MTEKYDPFNNTYDDNIRKFVAALVANDIDTVKLFTFDTGYLTKNTIISNESLLESATYFTKFECWNLIYEYLGSNINNMPKGIYPFNYIVNSGKNSDPRIFQFLITLDLPDKNKYATEALEMAMSAKHQDTINVILESGFADPSFALQSAVVLNQSFVEKLLKYGGKLEYIQNNMDVCTFAMLREQPHPLLYARLPNNENGIYVALYNNDEKEIYKCFIDDVKKNFTYKLLPHPVLCAAQYSNIKCIKLLINLYRDYAMKNPIGHMMNMKLGGNENILNMVVKRPFDEEIYNYIISRNIDKNNISNFCTPLSAAVRQGDLVKVKFLLDNGCDPNIITPSGTTLMECIYCCYSKSNQDMMKLLLSHGADYNLTYPESQEYIPYRGMSAVDLCIRLNKPDLRLIKLN